MAHDLFFRVAVGVLAVGMYGNHIVHGRHFPKSEALGGWGEKGLIVAAILWTASLALYVCGYRWLSVPLPFWLRWTGVVCMLGCVPLSTWVYWTLGKHFSTKLQLLEEHVLVRHGPYRLVRHPMYATFFICAGATSVAVANVVILWLGFATACCMAWRIKQEEAMLVERFRETYLAYARDTGALWPKLPRRVPQLQRTLP